MSDNNDYMQHLKDKLQELKEKHGKLSSEHFDEARVHAAGKTDVDQDPNEEQIDDYEKTLSPAGLMQHASAAMKRPPQTKGKVEGFHPSRSAQGLKALLGRKIEKASFPNIARVKPPKLPSKRETKRELLSPRDASGYPLRDEGAMARRALLSKNIEKADVLGGLKRRAKSALSSIKPTDYGQQLSQARQHRGEGLEHLRRNRGAAALHKALEKAVEFRKLIHLVYGA